MNSILVKKQVKFFTKQIMKYGKPHILKVEVRWDDECGNKHNTFAITAELWKATRYGQIDKRYSCWLSGGCLHDDVAEFFPQLKPLLKWHLMGSDGPMHYIANTVYWARNAAKGGSKDFRGRLDNSAEQCLEYAKKSAMWLDASNGEFLPDFNTEEEAIKDVEETGFVRTNGEPTFKNLEKKLLDRLPALMSEFKNDIESLGFIW